MTVSRSGARLQASGFLKQKELDRALLGCLAGADVEDLPDLCDRTIEIDLTEASWFDLGALLWTITVMSRLKSQGNTLILQLPNRDRSSTDENFWSFLQRWRFFDALAYCVDDPINLLPEQQHVYLNRDSRYQRATSIDSHGEATELLTLGRVEIGILSTGRDTAGAVDRQIAEFNEPQTRSSLRTLCDWSEDEVEDFVQILLPHALRNVTHGRGDYAIVATRLDKKHLHVAVADNGDGIPSILRTALGEHLQDPDAQDSALIQYFAGRELIEDTIRSIVDSDLVVASTTERVTSEPGRPGMGLYYLKDRVLAKGGELRIRSGRAEVDFARPTAPKLRDKLATSPGTTIRMLLPARGRVPAR